MGKRERKPWDGLQKSERIAPDNCTIIPEERNGVPGYRVVGVFNGWKGKNRWYPKFDQARADREFAEGMAEWERSQNEWLGESPNTPPLPVPHTPWRDRWVAFLKWLRRWV